MTNLCLTSLVLITPSLKMGGMERILSLLAIYANKHNINVTIVCLIEKKIDFEIPQSVYVTSPAFQYKKNLVYKVRVFLYLHKFLKKKQPSSVLCFSEVFNPLSIAASKMAKTPIYISDRSSPYKPLRPIVTFSRKIIYPFANGIIAQTDLAKKEMIRKKFNANIAVIPNPLREINDSLEKSQEKIIVSAGRLIKSKNFEELIDIFNSCEQNKDWKLIILGDGPEKKNIEKKIKILNLQKKVILKGAVKDIDRQLANASIFASTSLSEGFPNALNEAMAFPLACIAYDCVAGPKDLIKDNRNGFLIPLNDKSLFIEKLNRLMSDLKLRERFKKAGIKNRQKFSQDKIISKYFNFITETEC